MRIKQISVDGLFGIFNHVIPIKMDERITVIHSPNGFGKTVILRILKSLFNSQYSELRKIPFKSFKVEFENDEIIEIVRDSNDSEKERKIDITFNLHRLKSKKLSFPLRQMKLSPNTLPISVLDEIIPGLERMGGGEWFYLPTEEVLSLEEVVERFGDALPEIFQSSYLKEEPEWLKVLKNSIHIRLIESERLLNFIPHRYPRTYRGIPSMVSTVSAYSKEVAELMQNKFREYGATSQSLDKTFPLRVVKQQPSADVTNEQLRQQLDELESTRSSLIEVGLIDKEKDSEFQIPSQDIDKSDESTKKALLVYLKDVEKKLDVFIETAKKFHFLRRIINKKFAYSYKEINFSKEKGFIFTTHHKQELLPIDLSSGEQHELVLLYELLFKTEPNSLVLIDEPELSLHVGWQVEFLKDLKEITELADLDILMATHSPDIIQDRWDLTVELKRPD